MKCNCTQTFKEMTKKITSNRQLLKLLKRCRDGEGYIFWGGKGKYHGDHSEHTDGPDGNDHIYLKFYADHADSHVHQDHADHNDYNTTSHRDNVYSETSYHTDSSACSHSDYNELMHHDS